jgi:hypothetical protein
VAKIITENVGRTADIGHDDLMLFKLLHLRESSLLTMCLIFQGEGRSGAVFRDWCATTRYRICRKFLQKILYSYVRDRGE